MSIEISRQDAISQLIERMLEGRREELQRYFSRRSNFELSHNMSFHFGQTPEYYKIVSKHNKQ